MTFMQLSPLSIKTIKDIKLSMYYRRMPINQCIPFSMSGSLSESEKKKVKFYSYVKECDFISKSFADIQMFLSTLIV